MYLVQKTLGTENGPGSKQKQGKDGSAFRAEKFREKQKSPWGTFLTNLLHFNQDTKFWHCASFSKREFFFGFMPLSILFSSQFELCWLFLVISHICTVQRWRYNTICTFTLSASTLNHDHWLPHVCLLNQQTTWGLILRVPLGRVHPILWFWLPFYFTFFHCSCELRACHSAQLGSRSSEHIFHKKIRIFSMSPLTYLGI